MRSQSGKDMPLDSGDKFRCWKGKNRGLKVTISRGWPGTGKGFRVKPREGLGCRQQLGPSSTYALSPSFLRICKPQSQVFRYLCASRPCKTPA